MLTGLNITIWISFHKCTQLATGGTIHEGLSLNKEILSINYFFICSLKSKQTHTIIQTNIQLIKNDKYHMSREEFYKIQCILMLITRFEFLLRVSLWSRTTGSKFIPAPIIAVFIFVKWKKNGYLTKTSSSSHNVYSKNADLEYIPESDVVTSKTDDSMIICLQTALDFFNLK